MTTQPTHQSSLAFLFFTSFKNFPTFGLEYGYRNSLPSSYMQKNDIVSMFFSSVWQTVINENGETKNVSKTEGNKCYCFMN